MLLEDKNVRNALRQVLDSAAKEGYLSQDEVTFTDNLFKKIDVEITRKTKSFHQLEGEIQQLHLTKKLIIDMIKEAIAAKERAKAREETADRIRSGKAARETFVIEEQIVEKEEKPKARRTHKKKEEK